MFFKGDPKKAHFKSNMHNPLIACGLVVAAASLLTFPTYAEQPRTKEKAILEVKPSMCVALNQGRNCYAQVTLQWSTLEAKSVCIVKKEVSPPDKPLQQNTTLKCWETSKGSLYSFEFEANKSVTYQLISMDKKPLAETTVEVSWVHEKSPRKRRWRLF